MKYMIGQGESWLQRRGRNPHHRIHGHIAKVIVWGVEPVGVRGRYNPPAGDEPLV